MNFKKIQQGLRAIRKRKFPVCTHPDDLDDLLSDNQNIKGIFANFRNSPFYQGMVEVNNEYKANIFVIQQIMDKVKEEEETQIWIDGTFNITPLFYNQLLVILVQIEKNVRFNLNF